MTGSPGPERLGRQRQGRRSIRLKGYDYTQAGAYFVTVCTAKGESLFGDVVDGVMVPSAVGRIVEDTWIALADRFPSLALDEFVVMPNHFHGIVLLQSPPPPSNPNPDPVGAGLALPKPDVGAGLALPEPDGGRGAASSAPTDRRGPALGGVLRAFKSISAIHANRLLGRTGQPLWQRNYYEHIIRDDRSLDSIRQYIVDNPARWAFDRENPLAAKKA